MNPSVEFVGSTIVVPLAVSSAIVAVARRFLPNERAGRIAVPFAFAVGFAAGYALFPGPWIPQRHWHWLPYLGLLAAFAGPFTTRTSAVARDSGDPSQQTVTGSRALESRATDVAILVVLAGVAAWFFVPSWDSLWPPRGVLVPLLGCGLLALTLLLQRLPPAVTNRSLVLIMTFASLALCVLTAVFVSISYAKLAMIASAALVGSGLTTRLTAQPSAVRALAPGYAIVLGGCAVISTLEPTPPLFAFGLLPWIPWLASVIVFRRPGEAGFQQRQMLRWLVAMAGIGLAAFLIHASTQVPTPDVNVEDHESMMLEEMLGVEAGDTEG